MDITDLQVFDDDCWNSFSVNPYSDSKSFHGGELDDQRDENGNMCMLENLLLQRHVKLKLVGTGRIDTETNITQQ